MCNCALPYFSNMFSDTEIKFIRNFYAYSNGIVMTYKIDFNCILEINNGFKFLKIEEEDLLDFL
jgi:hypothetical protein